MRDRKDSGPWAPSLMLFFLGSIVATLQWLMLPHPGFGSGFEAVAIARNLAFHGVFANPFANVETGPSAHLAPLFPFFLAALLKIFGNTALFVIAASLATIAMHGLHAALLPWISALFFGNARPGVYAAILSIALPALQFTPAWEAIYTAVGAMLFCLFTEWLLRKKDHSLLRGTAAGICCGVLLLLNPATLFLCAPWLLFLLIRRRNSVAVFAAFVCAAFLVCLPWNVRNYAQFHRWFFIRDNLGLELYGSNMDGASSSDAVNQVNGNHIATQLHDNPREAAKMLRMGEVEYNRARMADATAWIRTHPGRFLGLTARRFVEFWFPNPAGVSMYSYSIWAITALSIPGILIMLKERTPAVWFVISVLAMYPVIYYFVQTSIRFRYPVLWLSLLPAGYWIAGMLGKCGAANLGCSRLLAGLRRAREHPDRREGRLKGGCGQDCPPHNSVAD